MKLPAGLSRRKPPALPLKGASKEARAWWATVWASPMAAAWLEADVPGLVRLAELQERGRAEGQPSLSLLAEIRALEDRYGLSPMARRRLQWEVEQASGKAPEQPKEDASRWLRAIDG